MAVLCLRLCARALSSRGKGGPLLIAVRGPPTIAAPPAEHRLQIRRPSNCGPRAQPLRGMRDPPRPGPKPASPALAGRLPTTAPPGKPSLCPFKLPHLQLSLHIFRITSIIIQKNQDQKERLQTYLILLCFTDIGGFCFVLFLQIKSL